MRAWKILAVVTVASSLMACNTWWSKDEEDNSPFQGKSAKELFKEGETYLGKEEYSSAAKRFEAMESMYPFSNYAEKAQLDLIYAYYKDEQYPAAEATAERFIHLYPRSTKVDYAYYMKGLSNFQQNRGTFAKFLPMDESWRDPGTQSEAYSDFSTLVERFPKSQYKANALQRMIYLRNMFAQRELNASIYYYERGRYVAAVERASYCVKNYPQAPSSKDALSIAYYGNLKLGLKDAAQDALKVYQATYHDMPKEVHEE